MSVVAGGGSDMWALLEVSELNDRILNLWRKLKQAGCDNATAFKVVEPLLEYLVRIRDESDPEYKRLYTPEACIVCTDGTV